MPIIGTPMHTHRKGQRTRKLGSDEKAKTGGERTTEAAGRQGGAFTQPEGKTSKTESSLGAGKTTRSDPKGKRKDNGVSGVTEAVTLPPPLLTLSMHEAAVNHELNQKGLAMITTFQKKMQEEVHLNREQVFDTFIDQRKGLQEVINTYKGKFTELVGYLDDLHKSKEHIKRLKQANEELKLKTLSFMEQFSSELEEQEYEQKLLDDASLPPQALVQFLTDRIKLKMLNNNRLLTKIAKAEKEIITVVPTFQKQIKAEGVVVVKAAETLAMFKNHAEAEIELDNVEIARVEEKTALLQKDVSEANHQLDDQKKVLTALRDELKLAQERMKQEKANYKNKVLQVIHEHDSEVRKMRSQALSFQSHVMAYRNNFDACVHLDIVASDLHCPVCMTIMEKPLVLWPCGHSLCESCVEKGCNFNTTVKDFRVHCIECERAFKVAQDAIREAAEKGNKEGAKETLKAAMKGGTKDGKAKGAAEEKAAKEKVLAAAAAAMTANGDGDDDGDGAMGKGAKAGGDRLSAVTRSAFRDLRLYPNPYFRPPTAFNYCHYPGPNSVIAKLVGVYHKYRDHLQFHKGEYALESEKIDGDVARLWPDREAMIKVISSTTTPLPDAFPPRPVVERITDEVTLPPHMRPKSEDSDSDDDEKTTSVGANAAADDI